MLLGTAAQEGDVLYYLYGQMLEDGLCGQDAETVLFSSQAANQRRGLRPLTPKEQFMKKTTSLVKLFLFVRFGALG